MDISEKYVKMCGKAEEIQALANRKREGDWFADPLPIVNYEDYEQGWAVFDGIWLPRQDQLQEMLNLPILNLIAFFKANVIAIPAENWLSGYYTSMEQLWLAFVMNKCYSKQWDGENWIDSRKALDRSCYNFNK